MEHKHGLNQCIHQVAMASAESSGQENYLLLVLFVELDVTITRQADRNITGTLLFGNIQGTREGDFRERYDSTQKKSEYG